MAWQPLARGAAAAVLALLAVLCGRRGRSGCCAAGGLPAARRLPRERVLTARYDCGERQLVHRAHRFDSGATGQSAGSSTPGWMPAAAPRHAPLRAACPHGGAKVPGSGERWQLLLQFDQPSGGQAADDRRRGLLRDHVSAMARVLRVRLEPAPGAGREHRSMALRVAVADRIEARVADPSAAALLAALAVGVTGDVSPQQWRVFNATGITHLVAISGMHVTFFAMLSMALARVLWRRSAWLARGCCGANPLPPSWASSLALAYALLSGFSVPAQRTVVMLAAFLVARDCARHARPRGAWRRRWSPCWCCDPLAVLSAGFWLSFGAVAVIVLLAGAPAASAGPAACGRAGAVGW